MASQIDPSRLTLRDALDLAVLIEDEAHERYVEFAEQMAQHDTPDAEAFFRFMADNEAKHGAELAARRKALFRDEPSSVSRSMIFDIEAPDYDEARAFMSPREALSAAMRSEEKAWAYFDAALPHIIDPEVRALFEELRADEVLHKQLVKAELAKLPPGKDADPSDYVDEPNAQ